MATPSKRVLNVVGKGISALGAADAGTVLFTAAPNPPTNLAISAGTIAENSPALTSIGSLTATGPGQILTWSLPNSSDQAIFKIDGGKSDQLYLNWSQLDFSVTTTYTPTITVTNSLGASASFTPTITVTASTNPGGLAATPVIGIDFRKGLTLSGSNVTAAAAQWGATGGNLAGIATFNPTVQTTGGPSSQQNILMGTSQGMSFTTTGALSAFDASFVIAPTNVNNLAVIAKVSNNQSFFQFTKNGATTTSVLDKLTFRDDSAASSTTLTLTTPIVVGQYNKIRLKFDGTTLSVIINDATAVTSSAASGHTFTFTQLGKIAALASTDVTYYSMFVLYSAVLSSGDATTLSAWLQPYMQSRLFIDSVAGSDSNLTAWMSATPNQTVGGINMPVLPARTGIYFKRGSLFNDGIELLPTKNITIDAYGTGVNPIFEGNTPVGANWTVLSGQVYTTPLAYSPLMGWAVTGNPAVRKGVQRLNFVAASAGQAPPTNDWDMTLNTTTNLLQVQFPVSFNPNSGTVYIAANNTTSGVGVASSSNACVLKNLTVRYWAGWAFKASAAATFINCNGSWCYNDSFGDTNPTGTISLYQCIVLGSGPPVVASGNGDGFSYHGDSVIYMWRCIAYDTCRGALHNTATTQTTAEYCEFRGSYDPIRGLNQNVGSNSGFLKLTRCIIEIDDLHDKTVGNLSAIQAQSGLPNNFVLTVDGCTLINKITTGGVSVAVQLGDNSTTNTGMTGTVTNTITQGFTFGVSNGGAGGLISEDYNYVNGSNALISGTGAFSGGHSVLNTSPQFVSLSTGDYHLVSTSPCIDIAHNSTAVFDADGRQSPYNVTNDMGAYEYTP